MDIFRFNFLRGIILSVVACMVLFVWGGRLLGEDGGAEGKVKQLLGKLFVTNDTEYDLKFTVEFPAYWSWSYKSWQIDRTPGVGHYISKVTALVNQGHDYLIGDYETLSFIVPKKSQSEEEVFSSKVSKRDYFFGTFGKSSEKLIITSDEWPEDERIVVRLRTSKKNDREVVVRSYDGEIDPFLERDRKKKYTPRITWHLEWKEDNGGVWLMILEQSDTGTGYIPKIRKGQEL